MKTTEKEKVDKKDRILDVAEHVFSELGYDGASTRTISGEAGVNMAMLNYYFGSKEGLFLAVIERRTATFKDFLQNINSDNKLTSWKKVELYIEAYVDRILNNNSFQKLLYREMSILKRTAISDQMCSILMHNVVEFRKILQEGIDRNEFKKDVDTDMVIATIYGAKNFIMNTPNVSSKMLGYDVQNQEVLDQRVKPRFKTYLKNLLKSYLLN
ncbi:TetR/AcrR family transcriptional regulator [Mucilaginibacter sp.]